MSIAWAFCNDSDKVKSKLRNQISNLDKPLLVSTGNQNKDFLSRRMLLMKSQILISAQAKRPLVNAIDNAPNKQLKEF